MANEAIRDVQFQEEATTTPASPAAVTAEELLGLCADSGNVEAWEEFLRRFHPLIVATALRTARRYTAVSTGLCDDLTQEVYLKLSAHGARLLRQFEPRHPGAAYGYIKVVTMNTVHDYFKVKGRLCEDELPADSLYVPEEMDGHMLERDVDDLLRKHARDTDREIFWLYYRRGMTAKEIALLPAVPLSVKGVESVLVRLARLLREKLKLP